METLGLKRHINSDKKKSGDVRDKNEDLPKIYDVISESDSEIPEGKKKKLY